MQAYEDDFENSKKVFDAYSPLGLDSKDWNKYSSEKLSALIQKNEDASVAPGEAEQKSASGNDELDKIKKVFGI